MTGETEAEQRRILTAKIAEQVREESRSTGRLSPLNAFFQEPYNLNREDAEEVLRSLAADQANADIRVIRDDKRGDLYLYASPHVCEAYAASLLLAKISDPCDVIAETVREESRLYPRPTCSLLFHLPPYGLSPEAMPSYVREMGRREEMRDIKTFEASNGVSYFYSERHMSLAHARGLAEWIEVEQFENQ
jgi:hypothetical protein